MASSANQYTQAKKEGRRGERKGRGGEIMGKKGEKESRHNPNLTCFTNIKLIWMMNLSKV